MIYVDISNWDNNYEPLSEAQWTRLQVLCDSAKSHPYEDRTACKFYSQFTVSAEQAQELAEMGIKLQIKPLPTGMFTKLQESGDYWRGKYGDVVPQDLTSGNAVHIHIPDMGLMMMKRVTYMLDACTDELQNMLDDGWKILAVCPPNAQRRPDYILGHTDKDAS